MKGVLFDYGAGNHHSLLRAFLQLGVTLQVEADPKQCLRTELLVLPGVGAFGLAASRLLPVREELRRAIDDGLKCIGICLGMQILFDASDESPGRGLSVLPGRVVRLAGKRVPHMGWTRVDGEPMYFAHSFACEPQDRGVVTAYADYEGTPIVASISHKRTLGVQFHPEKSSAAGLALLGAMVRA